MNQRINCYVLVALITTTLLTPFTTQTATDCSANHGRSLANICLIGSGLIAGFFGGKWIYNTFIKEKSDIEELLATEILYNEIYHTHYRMVLQYDHELCLINNAAHDSTATVVASLKQIIYKSKKGCRYPFIEYSQTLDGVVLKIDHSQKKLMNRKNILLARKLSLHKDNLPLSAEERAYFHTEYTNWYEKVNHLEEQIAKALDLLLNLKHHVVASEEYTQEMLLARLDYLENHVHFLNHRPTTHIMYVNNTNTHHNNTLNQRLDHLEQQIQAAQNA
jgi:hypothetical protein